MRILNVLRNSMGDLLPIKTYMIKLTQKTVGVGFEAFSKIKEKEC